MRISRRQALGTLGGVLALSGATVIMLAATAGTPPVPGSETLERVTAHVEPDPFVQPPAIDDPSRPPRVISPDPDGVGDPLALAPSQPSFIDIPAIGVQSDIQQVGLTDDHRMEVPAPGPLYDQAAWYKHSVTPGAVGPAVVVGHVDSARDGPSVFFDLGDLRRGDEVLITRRDGIVAVFSVEEVRQFPKDAFPTDLVYGDTGDATLRLITCGGAFDDAARTYRDNVVVFASLVRSYGARPSS